MPKKTINLNLDIFTKDVFNTFEVKQLEDIILIANITNKGEKYNVTNSEVRLFIGIGNEVYKQETDIAVSENRVIINLDRNLISVAGSAYGEIEIKDSDGTIASTTFLFHVGKRVGEGATLPGAIEGFVIKYDNLIAQAKSEIEKMTQEGKIKVDTIISQVGSTVDSKLSKLQSDYDTTKSEVLNDTYRAIEEVDNRFKELTANQQQESEIIDARDGEVSIRARLERDLRYGKIIYEDVEG